MDIKGVACAMGNAEDAGCETWATCGLDDL